jgi:hypothetical protein
LQALASLSIGSDLAVSDQWASNPSPPEPSSSRSLQESQPVDEEAIKDDNRRSDLVGDEFDKLEDNNDWSHIIVTPDHSASVGQTYQHSNSEGIAAYDEIQRESPALIPLKMDSLGPHELGGNRLRLRKSSIVVEEGSRIRIEATSVETGRYPDSTSSNFLDPEALRSVVETTNQDGGSDSAQSRHTSLHSSLPGDNDSSNEPRPQSQELFHAFPETRWFRSITFAVVGFCIMTLMVLGNLIYTYVLLLAVIDL